LLNIDGVVVFYNPNDDVIENIKSYIKDIRKLYIIDNSENKNEELINKIINQFSNVEYFWLGENKGIAYALNKGAELAIKNGAEWLLTMDQDSKFKENVLRKMINFIKTNDTSKVGIISPLHKMRGDEYIGSDDIIEKITVMTSGNLLNLFAYKKCNKFRDDYFIDYVDHEYCLRLRKNGFKILVLTSAVLYHNLGTIKVYNFFRKKIKVTNHSPLRRYYISRNRLDVFKKYIKNEPYFVLLDLKSFLLEWIKILLFEQNKWKKSKFIVRGIKDFLIGKKGKY